MNPVSTSEVPTSVMKANRLRLLPQFGQSIWLDYIRRSLIKSGELQRLIDEDELRGVTSNPSIFEKAIAGSTDYAEALERLRVQRRTARHKDNCTLRLLERLRGEYRQPSCSVQFELRAGSPLFVRHLEQIDLRHCARDVEQGIKAVRLIFPRLYVDSDKAGRLVDCLKRYRRSIPITTAEPAGPLHDEFSHGADALRYLALIVDQMVNEMTFRKPIKYPKRAYA